MQHASTVTLLLVIGVTVVAGTARRFGWSEPLLLVAAGVLVSLIPGVPHVELDPDVVLVLVLPPLLYSAALGTSLRGISTDRRSVGLLSVGYVLFATVVVGLLAAALVPGLSLGPALVLGAILAPTDAVAAVSIGRRVGLPRRLLTVLEGESLLNDATALTAYRIAVTAVVTAGFSWWHAASGFVVAAAGGLVVGWLVAVGISALRRRLQDALLENALSLLTPFVAYIPAERIGGSGVLAVVVTGLILGHRAPQTQTSAARLQSQAVWRMIDFLLEGLVFALIGLQLRTVLSQLSGYSTASLVGGAAAVLASVVVVRFLWIYPVTFLPRLLLRDRRGGGPTASWQSATVLSWAGMRGVVSLAAAFAIPNSLDSHQAFPARALVLFLTLVVILGTLFLQGFTLPWLIQRLGVQEDPSRTRLAEAQAAHLASRAGLARLEELIDAADPLPAGVVERLREKGEARSLAAWERIRVDDERETPSAAYARLRAEMLAVERAEIVGLRDAGRIDDDVLRRLQAQVDVEETLLRRDLA